MRLFRAIATMLALLTAVPILVVGFILIDSSVTSIKTLTWEMQQERTQHASRIVLGLFENVLNDIDLLVSNVSLAGLNLRQRQDFLSFVLQKQPALNIIGLYDRGGRPLHNLLAFDAGRILPSELSEHLSRLAMLLKAPLEAGRVRFSAPYRLKRDARPELSLSGRDEMLVAVALPIDAPDIGALGLELSLEGIKPFLEQMRLGKRGEVFLVDQEGMLVFYKQGEKQVSAPDDVHSRELARLLHSMLAQAHTGTVDGPRVSGARPLRLPDGREVLAAYSPLAKPGGTIISVEPLDEAYTATRRMTWQVVTVVLVSLTVALIIGLLFAFGITRPIGKCVSGALSIARGNFGTVLDIKTRNEIGELAHTFNYMSQQLLRYDKENRNLVESLERGYLETIRALANSIDAKDPYTRGHSMRVTNVALAIGRKLGLSNQELRLLRYGGILHDIGKIGIPESILAKAEKLSDAERQLVQNHPVLGEKIIAPIDFLNPVRPLVRCHHEWFNGSGYPDGLRGDQIPLGAKIINAADTYDAVTSERPYQKAVDNREAIEILRRLRGLQFDPSVCDALISIIEERVSLGEAFPRAWDGELTDPAV